MSSRPKQVLWNAEPHTIAKIEIIKRYAHRWATILGRSFRDPLTYIDGFAGPGCYLNHPEGSPTATLKAFADAKSQLGESWLAGPIRCFFIETDQDRLDNLRQECSDLDLPSGIRFESTKSTFVDGLAVARQKFDFAFSTQAPLLVFVDPFGATGAPFRTIKSILASRTSEVLINFDADGVARIWRAKDAADHDRNLTEIFGSEVWRSVRESELSYQELCFECARLYKQELLKLPRVDYAFSFQMGNSATQLDYFLIFASQSSKGLVKMKEVMKAMDQTGDFKFYDTHVGQRALIEFNDPDAWIPVLAQVFRNRKVSYAELERWIYNETPFTAFSSTILKPAQERGLVEAIAIPGASFRKGTFPKAKIGSFRFRG